jgi:hypothetical protein
MGAYLPHINCSKIVLIHYTMEWRLLRNWKVHALLVTAAEGLSDSAWVLSFDFASLESAALLGDDDKPSVQRCQRGRSKKNRHVGRSPTYCIYIPELCQTEIM